MKKIILTILCAAAVLSLGAQAKQPSLMVVPSDVWCNTNGYVSEYDNQGVKQIVPDYRRALQSDANLVNVISRINNLMAERGFPLKNLESVMKSLERNEVEQNMLTSKSGSSIAETPLDRLRRTAKADIILQLTWTVNTLGPKKSVTYNLQALDAYTDEQVAGAQGTGSQSFSTEIPVLLEEAVSRNMDNFTDLLQSHFEDVASNGRAISLDIKVFDNGSDFDLETEIDGSEVTEIIDAWLDMNTVNHMFSKADASETYTNYEQVRIPLYKANGVAMDAEAFARDLRKYLAGQPFGIPSKLLPRGLGRAVLVLGEK